MLLIADDLGLDCGCYGNTKIKTPNIDALAGNGTLFTHGFAGVSVVQSEPGLHLHRPAHAHQRAVRPRPRHAQRLHVHECQEPAAHAAQHGYRTGIIGKVHVQPQSIYPHEVKSAKGVNPRNVGQMAQKAREFITDSGDKPFLLVMGYTDPHRSEKGFANEKPYKDVPEIKYDPKDVQVPFFLPDQPETPPTWPTITSRPPASTAKSPPQPASSPRLPEMERRATPATGWPQPIPASA